MGENEKHLQIMAAIAKLDVRMSVVETKLDGLNTKVAIQNGRVSDSEAAIRKILNMDNYKDGYNKATAKTWKYIVGIILAIAAMVIAYFYH